MLGAREERASRTRFQHHIKVYMSEPTRTKDEAGREIITYPSGARKWADNGQWLNGPTDPQYNPVLADPKAMVQRRNSISRQKAIEAIDEAAEVDPSKFGTGEGWKKVIRHATQVILDAKSPRGIAELLGKVGTAAGYFSREEAEKIAPRGITSTPEELLALLSLLDDEIKARVAKAQALDGETR